jgi:hypothetical protein
MKIQKKKILLCVRRSSAEVDFILPLLYKLSFKYDLITIFDNLQAYNSLKDNKEIFLQWKKINNLFYIREKKNNFFYKLLYKSISTNIVRNIFKKIINKFENKLQLKINQNILGLRKFNYNNIALFFLSDSNYSSLPLFFKYKNSKIKIIRFPESVWLVSNKTIEKQEIDLRLIADKYLVPTKKNLFLFGKKANIKIMKKIIFTGYFKYQKWWVDKISQYTKIENSNFKILVATRPFGKKRFQGDFTKESYEYLVKSIMEISSKIKNSLVIFKIHPKNLNTEKFFLLKILSNYKKNWIIKKNHIFKLAKISNACISLQSSACLDMLAVQKGVVEFWLNSTDYRYLIPLKMKNVSVFENEGLILNINSKKELEKVIFRILNKEKLFKNKIKNFNKINKNYISYKKLNKLLLN